MRNKKVGLAFLLAIIVSINVCFAMSQEEAKAELTKSAIPFNETSFVNYAAMGNEGVVNLFLEAGMNPSAKNAVGWTSVMYVAYNNQINILKSLINAGADVNATTIQNETAIYFAAMRGNKDAVETLIAGGANPNVKTKLGQTPAYIAKALGHKETLAVLEKNQYNNPYKKALSESLIDANIPQKPLMLTDIQIQKAINEGVDSSKFDSGVIQKASYGSYAIEARLVDAYTMVKNYALFCKQRNLPCTPEKVKDEILSQGMVRINWVIFLKHHNAGAGPNKYTYNEEDFVLIQGNKSIKPDNVKLMLPSSINPSYDAAGAIADVFLPVPIFGLGYLANKTHLYTVETMWDWSKFDGNKPIAVRLFFGEKYVEVQFVPK